MSQQRESRRRNNKIEPLQRGYGCPCGKTYLSYPALFTHIKQKHDGKAPGDITKPKNQQTRRGRPRTNSSLTEAEQPFEMEDNPLEHIQEVIDSEEVQPETELKLEKVEAGKETVMEVLNLFLNQSLEHISESSMKIVSGFMQVIRISVDRLNGEEYCTVEDASEIIEAANEIVRECEKRQKSSFRMSKDGVIQMTKLFFEWLYKSNLTDHVIEDQKNNRLEV